MFYRLEELVTQSAGIVRRDDVVADTVAVLVEINDLLKKQGIRFVVASPPNSASIYADELPRWLRNQGRFTEYDLLLGALRAHGVNVVDLRAPLRQARMKGNMYFFTIRTGLRAVQSSASILSRRRPGTLTGNSTLMPRC
jgi:hypothetical protein